MRTRHLATTRNLLLILIVTAVAATAHAQWATNGNNINNTNTGNVGIGTTAPITKLHILNGDLSLSPDFGVRKSGDNFIFGYISTLPGVVMGSGTLTDKFKINAGGVERFRIETNGFVGIGTNAPNNLLHLRDPTYTHTPQSIPSSTVGLYIERDFIGGSEGAIAVQGSTKATVGAGRIYLGNSDEWDSTSIWGGLGTLIFYARNAGAPAVEVARITPTGNFTVSGNIAAKYQDVAEWVPSSDDLAPGTVVVLSLDHNNQVTPSTHAYDTAVAGVVSLNPGVILGEESSGKEKIATTGRVRVRVDASKMPICIGDLLVTSDRPGFAMRSEPVNVSGIQMHRPGTIVGKALEPLASGEGEILVLLSLQ